MLVDSHCHIHDADYPLDRQEVLSKARAAGIQKIICVGDNEPSSLLALDFARQNEDVFAAVGVHPHESKNGYMALNDLLATRDKKLVAVGEIGLDYHYDHSPHDVQAHVLRAQIELAQDYDLPIIFHVREAFDDFWPIFDELHGKRPIRGVIHSFSDTPLNADRALERGLYIGVNGICTFTKDPTQQKMFHDLPLDRILLETDAPFLTPAPFRGTINEPALVGAIASYVAQKRNISLDQLASTTTSNAQKIFGI
jgi:TatD DNase family protein